MKDDNIYRKTPIMGWASWNCFRTHISEAIDKARELMKDGAALVDVRAEEEYTKAHLDGAVNLSYLAVGMHAKKIIPDKTAPVIVYCATGKRSMQAKTCLDYLGYERVYYLGGVEELC